MADVASDGPHKSSVRIGWVLLAVALATPGVLGALDVLSPYEAGRMTVHVGVGWLVAALAADFINKSRGPASKANGRIVAAVLALVGALSTGYTNYSNNKRVNDAKNELIEQFMTSAVESKNAASQPQKIPPTASAPTIAPVIAGSGNEADRAVAFFGKMKIRVKEFAEESSNLDRQFGELDLSGALKPENLLTAEGVAASRKQAETYRRLVNQRDKQLAAHFNKAEEIIRTSGLTEREARQALEGLNSTKASTIKIYADLGAAQLGSLKAITDLLSFGEQIRDRSSVKNGQLMFRTQPELDEYQRLMKVLGDASNVEDAVTQRFAAQAQVQKQKLVDEYKR